MLEIADNVHTTMTMRRPPFDSAANCQMTWLAALTALTAACSSTPELYCDENTACSAGLPFCDLAGECPASGGISNTCIPQACWDAGSQPDASVIADANAAADAADPDAGPPPEMVLVAAGAFDMGCATNTDTCARTEELPLHTVTLAEFEIDRLEVTQERYAACVTAGACSNPAGVLISGSFNYDPAMYPQHPVVKVNWSQAVDYCAWVGKRLPTEAEWEKAARSADLRKWPWGNSSPTCAYAQIVGCGGVPIIAGSKPIGASPYGALDMAGNALEWVADRYADDYYASSPSDNPPGPSNGVDRVIRGGGYFSVADSATTTRRFGNPPDEGNEIIGFRCARTIQ